MQRFRAGIRLLDVHMNKAMAAILAGVFALSACSPGVALPIIDPSPGPKIMVISANLRESHPNWPDDITGAAFADLQSMGELTNFVDHLAEHVPAPPDVLLLQEVIAPSARETALRLRKKFDLPYRVVIAGHDSNQVGPKFDNFKHKQNTAIIVNSAQIEVVGKVGFFTLTEQPGDWSPDRFGVAQEQAHALLRDRTSGVGLAVMSIHWSSTPKFRSRPVATMRRVKWARQTKAFMAERFGAADIQVMGGEFNLNRCGVWIESLRCDQHPAYEVLAGARRPFEDAVLAVSRHSRREFRRQVENRKGDPHRIDYIFVAGEVHAASRSVGYDTKQFTPRFISDHKYDFALIGS